MGSFKSITAGRGLAIILIHMASALHTCAGREYKDVRVYDIVQSISNFRSTAPSLYS